MVRAYGAGSFEEEKRLILCKAHYLAQWDRQSGQCQETWELFQEFVLQFRNASPEVRDDREAMLAALQFGDICLSTAAPWGVAAPAAAPAAALKWGPAIALAIMSPPGSDNASATSGTYVAHRLCRTGGDSRPRTRLSPTRTMGRRPSLIRLAL
eukprot:CAMPEP_0206536854 /NCGR_PEP_ID=MMETSP0325_2-20121206/6996_1 /ASSEMBLY_ACC=CAM_ASM_000347 /TAXON_ID=2866 /ORGANISM="Crypthecodinium cohnii, Strain Seligo" /LENGTH=153 /DNA_ID=CAMNT_0054034143 /DNA_START=143 /DNA_END=605 /DNA_ORIENTATION=+